MKNTKRLLAVLLALVMTLSCLAGISFADSNRARPEEKGETAQPAEGHGFQSMNFRENNSYRYADDELVVAIVLLKGEAPAELPAAKRAAAASRLAAQHNTFRNALRKAGISYSEEFEYDSLLNGFALTVAYGDLAKIAAINGVKAVHIANHYDAPVMTPAEETRMASSNVMTGIEGFQRAGYDGKGMVIAVLDTGITPDHEAFQVYGDKLGEVTLDETTAKAFIEAKGYGTYLSEKIPFSYDYYDLDDDATDDKSGHGTHVSGIAAGYAETEEGEIVFCGTAPYAQLVEMKIFSSGPQGGTNSGIYFAALEDAYELDVDVINMSIGAQNGFTYDFELEDEVLGNIYQTLEENGIIVSCSAGNEDSMAENSSSWAGAGYVTSDYADYGVVGTPSTYDGNLSVASAENEEYPNYILRAGDRDIVYYDAEGTAFYMKMAGEESEYEYVVIDGYGTAEDFLGVNVKGKIALISRGDITFQEKVDNAAKAGAAAAVIYNNQDGTIYMSINPYRIPAVSITQEDGEYLKSIAVMPEPESEPESAAVLTVRKAAVAPETRRSAAAESIRIDRDGLKTARDTRALRDTEETAQYYWVEELVDGDEAVLTFEYVDENAIYAISTTPNGNGLTPVEVPLTVSGGDYIVEADPATMAFTVSINDDDQVELISQDGKFLTSAPTGNGLTLEDESSDYSLWEIEEVTSEEGGVTYTDGYYFKNVNAFYNEKQQYLEYYNGKVTTYSYNSSNDDNYLLFFYVADGGSITPPITPSEDVIYGCYFEDEGDFDDWTLVDKDDDGSNWGITGYGEAFEGSGVAYSESYDIATYTALTPDNWAISPAIDLDGIEEASVSFYAAGADSGYADEVFAIYAGVSPDPDAMTKLTDDITVTGDWANYGADLSDFAGETIYVAIRHYNCTDQYALVIDQFEVLKGAYVPPEPPAPPVTIIGDVVKGFYFEEDPATEGWTFVDSDDDGFNWIWSDASAQIITYEGASCIYSESYDSTSTTALTPDNWAISPAVSLDGVEEAVLSLYACGQDKTYCAENFQIYAGITANPEEMTPVSDLFTTTGEYTQYTADLADFLGETIYIAIRHYNVTDMFYLNIDQVEVLTNIEIVEPFVLGGEVEKGYYFETDPADEGWTFVDADGDGYTWEWTTDEKQNVYEGAGIIHSASYINDVGALTPDNWAISPAFDLSEIDDAVISLYACGQDPDYAAENFEIFAGTSPDVNTMFQISDDFVATGDYVQYYAPLFDFAGEKEVYVAIRHCYVSDEFWLNVDQVELLTGTNYVPPIPPEPVDRPIGTLSFPLERLILPNENGWLMSTFSSWGCTPSLTLKPKITGIGGNVDSASAGTTDRYEVMSGTSMSSPNVAGMMADISEYIEKNITRPSAENPFEDVEEGRFYYDAVLWAVNHEPLITNGVSATEFAPGGDCTRGQVVTFLWRAVGQPAPSTTETDFVDIVAGAYYYNAVLWAVEAGVTKGVSATEFRPGDTCTRGQVVTFLYRALGEPEVTATECPFEDVVEGAYYYKAMLWAVENGVTNGVSDTEFAPANVCNRGQVVTFLYRAFADVAPAGDKLSKVERAELAEVLAESSALILADADGAIYSPRKQGSGLANMSLLTAANAYIVDPIKDLLDNEDGEFEFTFTVKDLYGTGGSYAVTPIVLTDTAVAADLDENDEPELYNVFQSMTLETAPYEYEGETYPADVEVEFPETVVVPANGETEVTIKIKLTEDTRAYLDAMFPNGTYIEGYIVLEAADAEAKDAVAEVIHATYMGFYGNWSKAPILEQHDWTEIVDAYNWLSNTAADEEGNTYADYGYTYLDAVDFQVTTDVNVAYALNSEYYASGQFYGGYAGDNLYGYDPEITFNADRVAIAPESGIVDMLYMMTYQLRNARHLIMVATDAETGEVYYVDDTEYLPKSYFDSDYASWSNSGVFMYDGTDAEGNALPNGTMVNLTYYANLAYGEDALGALIGEEGDYSKLLEGAADYVVWEIPVLIDTEAPAVVGYEYDAETNEITVQAQDNGYVAAIFMANDQDEIVDSVLCGEDEAGAVTEATFTYPEGSEFVTFYVADYATNEGSGMGYAGEPKTVTLTFHYPEGTELVGAEEEYVGLVGETFALPEVVGETKLGEFTGWSLPEIPEIVDYDTFEENYYDDFVGFGGSEIQLTEDLDGADLYALYEIAGDPLPYDEELELVSDALDDWSGLYAINGYDWTLEDGDEAPIDYFLDNKLEPANPDGENVYTDYFLWLGWLVGAPEDWMWQIEAVEGGYTVKTLSDGKYLAVEEGAMTLIDEADETAIWEISFDDESACVLIVNSDLALVFDENAKDFTLADVTDESFAMYEPFNLALFGLEASGYFYTTNPNQDLPEPPPAEGSFELLEATPTNNGEQTVIVLKSQDLAVSTTANGNKLEPAEVTIEDRVITSDTTGLVFEIEIDGDGHYLFKADGKYLTAGATGNALTLGEKTEYSTWELVPASETDGDFFLKSVNAKYNENDQFLEYYNNLFTTYGKNGTADPAIYTVNFYTYGVG